MSARNRLLQPGGEAQWCLFDPILSVIHGQRYQKTGDAGQLESQTAYLNRSLRQLTGEGGSFPPLRCPESSYRENGVWGPNDITPLLWTQANVRLALHFMEQSAATCFMVSSTSYDVKRHRRGQREPGGLAAGGHRLDERRVEIETRGEGGIPDESNGEGSRHRHRRDRRHLAAGHTERRRFPSGKDLTPAKMVAEVTELAKGWEYHVVSIGYPGPVREGRPAVEPHNLARGWVGFDFQAALRLPGEDFQRRDNANAFIGGFRMWRDARTRFSEARKRVSKK